VHPRDLPAESANLPSRTIFDIKEEAKEVADQLFRILVGLGCYIMDVRKVRAPTKAEIEKQRKERETVPEWYSNCFPKEQEFIRKQMKGFKESGDEFVEKLIEIACVTDKEAEEFSTWWFSKPIYERVKFSKTDGLYLADKKKSSTCSFQCQTKRHKTQIGAATEYELARMHFEEKMERSYQPSCDRRSKKTSACPMLHYDFKQIIYNALKQNLDPVNELRKKTGADVKDCEKIAEVLDVWPKKPMESESFDKPKEFKNSPKEKRTSYEYPKDIFDISLTKNGTYTLMLEGDQEGTDQEEKDFSFVNQEEHEYRLPTETKCPVWYSRMNEHQKNHIKICIGDSSWTRDLENLLMDECGADRKDVQNLLRWWYGQQQKKQLIPQILRIPAETGSMTKIDSNNYSPEHYSSQTEIPDAGWDLLRSQTPSEPCSQQKRQQHEEEEESMDSSDYGLFSDNELEVETKFSDNDPEVVFIERSRKRAYKEGLVVVEDLDEPPRKKRRIQTRNDTYGRKKRWISFDPFMDRKRFGF